MKPWHEDDAFWQDTATILFGERRWSAAPQEVEQAMALLNVPPGSHLLDLCCGVGRHSLELARRGYRVTGVDRTAAYLATARQKAEAEGLNVEWVQADMREFCRPAAFEAAINLFTSFGYFEDPADDRRVAANLYHSLKPGGKLLMDTMGKEVLARVFRPTDWHEEGDLLVLEERELSQNWGWIENRWILLQGEKRIEHRFGHRLYAATELIALLKSVGFASAEAYGDLGGSPYDQNARRLVVLAGKRSDC